MSENKNSMNRLYDKLFDTMDNISDDPKSITKAKAVVEVSEAIVNVAKLEHNVAKGYGGQYRHTMSNPKQIPPQQDEPKQIESGSAESKYCVITAKSKPELYDKMSEFLEVNQHRSPELVSTHESAGGEWTAQYRMVK